MTPYTQDSTLTQLSILYHHLPLLPLPLVLPHVALQSGLSLLPKSAPLSWTGEEALLRVIEIPVLVDEHGLADLTLNRNQMHPLDVPF